MGYVAVDWCLVRIGRQGKIFCVIYWTIKAVKVSCVSLSLGEFWQER